MIYIHVPFCRSRCVYCDFYSVPMGGQSCPAQTGGLGAVTPGLTGGPGHALFQRYTDDLCAEIASRRDEIEASLGVNTLYIGGGTPSVLPVECLRRIVATLGGGPWDEFTIEVNPDDILRRGPGYVAELRMLGVTRISMGVQSLDDGILRWMNRRHDADGAREAFELLREEVAWLRGSIPSPTTSLRSVPPVSDGPFPLSPRSPHEEPNAGPGQSPQTVSPAAQPHHSLRSWSPLLPCRGWQGFAGDSPDRLSSPNRQIDLSVDIITGVPGMDLRMLEATVEEIVGWRPEHISAYQLSIAEGSALARMIAEGKVSEASEEDCRSQYEFLCSRLREAGYHHYEISNWALPGHEAVHNSAYWTRKPYVGLGPGAHSLTYLDANGRPVSPGNPGHAKERRSWNSQNIVQTGSNGTRRSPAWTVGGSEILSPEEIREEEIMLLARTDLGRIPERDWFISDDLITEMI